MQTKFDKLKNFLNDLNKQGICLAYSGGVDSLLLLYFLKDLNAIAITLSSCFQTNEEINSSKDFAKRHNIKHKIITYSPLENENILNNSKERCYFCKKLMFSKIVDFAKNNNYKYIIDGTNYDDINQYRPGLKVLDELGVISPFKMFEITKKEIREYLKNIDINLSNKPSSPCLATRFPYDTKLSVDKLKMVEKLEGILYKQGFLNNRVRLHNNIARIEILKEDYKKAIRLSEDIIDEFKKYNIDYIALDLEGLRNGSMDI